MALIHLCKTFVALFPILYDVNNLVKELLFHIIEHDILSDDFVNDLDLSVLGTSLRP